MSRTFFSDAAVGIAPIGLGWRAWYAAISRRVSPSWMIIPFGYRLLGILWSPAKGGPVMLPRWMAIATPTPC